MAQTSSSLGGSSPEPCHSRVVEYVGTAKDEKRKSSSALERSGELVLCLNDFAAFFELPRKLVDALAPLEPASPWARVSASDLPLLPSRASFSFLLSSRTQENVSGEPCNGMVLDKWLVRS